MNIWGAFAILVTLFAIMCIIGMEHLPKGGQRDISKHVAAGATVLACIFGICGFHIRWLAPIIILVSLLITIIVMANLSDQRQ